MIEIKNLRKTYGKKVALKSFSYTFEDGIYGMLGANGAGKSTLTVSYTHLTLPTNSRV